MELGCYLQISLLFIIWIFCLPTSPPSERADPLLKAKSDQGKGSNHSLVMLVLDAQTSTLPQDLISEGSWLLTTSFLH